MTETSCASRISIQRQALPLVICHVAPAHESLSLPRTRPVRCLSPSVPSSQRFKAQRRPPVARRNTRRLAAYVASNGETLCSAKFPAQVVSFGLHSSRHPFVRSLSDPWMGAERTFHMGISPAKDAEVPDKIVLNRTEPMYQMDLPAALSGILLGWLHCRNVRMHE